jgi:S1-C subfamily serine protease
LAIIKITSKDFKMDKVIPYGLQFGIEDVGSEVFTMGYPLADVMGNEIKFTDGKISSKSGINGDIRMYQISTPIQPGNSGGPLFNSNGNVVGIVSATLNRENYNSENVNYAIKSNILKNLIDSSPEKITIKELSIEGKSTISDKIKSYQSFIPMVLIKL